MREASPEEYHLADLLKEIAGTLTKKMEEAKRKIQGMPHAKKELNSLWGLLHEPLFQITAAVDLLLEGVLSLLGRLLGRIGLGGLLEKMLPTLGLDNVIEGFGITGLTGGDKEKGEDGGGFPEAFSELGRKSGRGELAV